MTTKGDYSRVGGWLTLFCVVALAFNPLAIGIGLLSWLGLRESFEFVPNLSKLFVIHLTTGITVAIAGIVAAIHLIKVTRHAVRLANIYIAFSLTRAWVEFIVPLGLGLPREVTDAIVKESIVKVAAASVAAVAWALYFKKSKRVQATYGSLR